MSWSECMRSVRCMEFGVGVGVGVGSQQQPLA